MRIPALEHYEWQKGVISIQDTPPASPSRGDSYIVGEGFGNWSGQDGKIAIYDVSGWTFIAPVKGMFCFVKDVDKLYYYVISWEEFTSTAGGGDISGAGTNGKIAKWTGEKTIGDGSNTNDEVNKAVNTMHQHIVQYGTSIWVIGGGKNQGYPFLREVDCDD